MKVLAILLLFLSVFVDGTLPLFENRFLFSNLTFTTLILIYPLFLKNKKTYILLLIISSVSYDILYTNILFLNTVLFFCIFLIFEKNYKSFNYFSSLQYFLLYELLLFSLLYTISFTKDLFFILKLTMSSFLINFIYTGILYIIFKDKYKFNKTTYN